MAFANKALQKIQGTFIGNSIVLYIVLSEWLFKLSKLREYNYSKESYFQEDFEKD